MGGKGSGHIALGKDTQSLTELCLKAWQKRAKPRVALGGWLVKGGEASSKQEKQRKGKC